MFKCIKCNKNFTSQYILNKHVNRKVPCTVVIQCKTCEKVFPALRDLERHNNRVTPCTQPVIQYENKIMLEIQKDKNAEQMALNIIKAKFEAAKELELIKSARKQQTPHVINNININITINTYINNVTQQYLPQSTQFVNNVLDNGYKRYENYFTEIDSCAIKQNALDLFNDYANYQEIIRNILLVSFNEKKYIFYAKDLDKYFGAFIKDHIKIVKELSFTDELLPHFKRIVRYFVAQILRYVKAFVKMEVPYKEDNEHTKNFLKHQALEIYQNNKYISQDNVLKGIANQVFEVNFTVIENIIHLP
jgi:hypothetical protein